MAWLVFAGVVVLSVMIFLPLLGWLIYRLDSPQTEEAWRSELASYEGWEKRFVAREYRAWKRRNHHVTKEGTRGALDSVQNLPPSGSLRPHTGDGCGRGGSLLENRVADNQVVLPGGSERIRRPSPCANEGVSRLDPDPSSGDGGTGGRPDVPGENRGPLEPGVLDSSRVVQPAGPGGGQRPEPDGHDSGNSPESFAEALERRGRELGV